MRQKKYNKNQIELFVGYTVSYAIAAFVSILLSDARFRISVWAMLSIILTILILAAISTCCTIKYFSNEK